MNRDSVAEPGQPIPDRVPDDLMKRYGAEARRRVRYRRSRTHHVATRMKAGTGNLKGRLRDGDVWILALTVFGCSIIGLGLIGALVYSVLLWPSAGVAVLATLVVLLVVSYAAAVRLARRETLRQELEPTA